ncbi:MAG TPA: hypothetical protein VLF88_01270 [Candidatus Babeliales bacterium]|nr:hypothetical protein [Candidatus Babeliales bacterium]
MTLRIEEVRLGDLVRVLSPEGLDYFAQTKLSAEWPPYKNLLDGKFVRLGEVILLGADIDFGPDHFRFGRTHLQHEALLWHGFRGMGEDLQQRIKRTAPKDDTYLEDRWPLVDAGHSEIVLSPEARPIGLELTGSSHDYGRPDEATRQKTGELAQMVLGQNISVVTK